MDRLNTVFKAGVSRIEQEKEKNSREAYHDSTLESHIASQLRTGIASIDSKQPESVIGQFL